MDLRDECSHFLLSFTLFLSSLSFSLLWLKVHVGSHRDKCIPDVLQTPNMPFLHTYLASFSHSSPALLHTSVETRLPALTSRMSKLSRTEFLSHLRRKCFFTLGSAWKIARGMALSVTGAPSGFLEMMNRQERPASFTIWSPRNWDWRD